MTLCITESCCNHFAHVMCPSNKHQKRNPKQQIVFPQQFSIILQLLCLSSEFLAYQNAGCHQISYLKICPVLCKGSLCSHAECNKSKEVSLLRKVSSEAAFLFLVSLHLGIDHKWIFHLDT